LLTFDELPGRGNSQVAAAMAIALNRTVRMALESRRSAM
jgi:hypothetical protein